MNTLGTTRQTTAKKEESWSINHGYTSSVAVMKGTIVKLNASTGEVEPVTGVIDIPFGVVTAGCNDSDGGPVTVTTQFVGIYFGIADGAIALGDEVQASGVDNASPSDTGYTKYKKAVVGGNKVTAIALEDVNTTEMGWFGVLRVFYNTNEA